MRFAGMSGCEKIIKLILAAMVIFAAFLCFPKNYKIAVQNYEDRKEMITLTDPAKGDTREAWYFFQKGYYYITGIQGGTPDELLIGDELENVDDVSAYYGSVKVGEASRLDVVTADDGSEQVLASISWKKGKIAVFMALYALLLVAASVAAFFAIVLWKIKIPSRSDIGPRINVKGRDVFLFAGLALIYSSAVSIISDNILIKNVYPIEICFAALMLVVALIVEKQYSNTTPGTVISSVPIYVCLYFSVNKICAFTFTDGHAAIMEQLDYTTDSLRHFQKNTSRLNYIIMGTFERFNFIGKLGGETPAKLIHWFFGVCLLIYLIWFVVKRLLPETGSANGRAFRFTTLFAMVFTYNYTLEALKNYNYDLFSLSFGVIAFVHFLYAARTKRSKDAMHALIWATLGTLEKQIVWPIMLLCMLEYVVLNVFERENDGAAENGHGRSSAMLLGAAGTLKAALVTLAISMSANLWIQHISRGDRYFPAYTAGNLIRPLQGMMYALIKLFYRGWDEYANTVYVIGNLVQWLGVYIGFALIYALRRKLAVTEHEKNEAVLRMFIRILAPIGLFIMVMDIVFIYRPFYIRGISEMLFFLKASLMSFPTVILLGFVIALIVCLVKNEQHELMFFIVLFALIIPQMYSFVMSDIGGRYLNLFSLCSIVCLYLVLIRTFSDGEENGASSKTGFLQSALPVVCFVFILAESLEFAPAYLGFIPVWNQSYRGMLWPASFSVERQTAGEALQRYYAENDLDDSDVKIFFNYNAEWNAAPKNWTIGLFPAENRYELGDTTFEDVTFGKDVYYVFVSRAVVNGRFYMYPLPEDVEPFMTLTRRGVIEAVIYRADDLVSYFKDILVPGEG